MVYKAGLCSHRILMDSTEKNRCDFYTHFVLPSAARWCLLPEWKADLKNDFHIVYLHRDKHCNILYSSAALHLNLFQLISFSLSLYSYFVPQTCCVSQVFWQFSDVFHFSLTDSFHRIWAFSSCIFEAHFMPFLLYSSEWQEEWYVDEDCLCCYLRSYAVYEVFTTALWTCGTPSI